MTLARTGWRKQSMQEVREKQAIKRAKMLRLERLLQQFVRRRD